MKAARLSSTLPFGASLRKTGRTRRTSELRPFAHARLSGALRTVRPSSRARASTAKRVGSDATSKPSSVRSRGGGWMNATGKCSGTSGGGASRPWPPSPKTRKSVAPSARIDSSKRARSAAGTRGTQARARVEGRSDRSGCTKRPYSSISTSVEASKKAWTAAAPRSLCSNATSTRCTISRASASTRRTTSPRRSFHARANVRRARPTRADDRGHERGSETGRRCRLFPATIRPGAQTSAPMYVPIQSRHAAPGTFATGYPSRRTIPEREARG